MKTNTGQVQTTYSARGVPSYSVEIWHDGLNKHRLIKGSDLAVVISKLNIQANDWDERWALVSARNAQREDRQYKKEQLLDKKAEAASRTQEAIDELADIQGILKHTLSVNDEIDWERLKSVAPFSEPAPPPPREVQAPTAATAPVAPLASDKEYQPTLGFLTFLFPAKKRRAIEAAEHRLAQATAHWQSAMTSYAAREAERQRVYEEAVAAAKVRHANLLEEWHVRRADYLKMQKENNDAIDAQRQAYLAGNPASIVDYCDMVLSASEYPESFPQEFELDYNPGTKTLIVDYKLPSPDHMPRIKAVKYVASSDEFEEQYITEAQANKQYDDALYQICLRTIHELYEADVISAIAAIVFNGLVTSIDRSMGKSVTACLLSVHATRPEFLGINLDLVEPKQCFKSLKGVGSSKLHGLAPVPPIMAMSRDDARFVAAYAVADSLDHTSNLAAISWEDFEHLIREMFEKEFQSSGGEVKVTQASRDGGVDAIAFDPDPIRGGKIVIQAKRYTSTVGVGAVRDLFGTVMNEGANKGILVTTSDYGPDSYAFAKGKPLQLLNGANLLSLLERHGFKAHINLNEARKIAKSV